MRFDAADQYKHSDFLTPHALFRDTERKIYWAALIKPTGTAVLLAIMNHANYQTRACYPSESTLARETGLSMPQVKREIKKLIAFGMIEKQTPKQKAFFDLPEREKSTNTYIITDRIAWHIPEKYEQPKHRSDRGKAHNWKARPQQLRLDSSICEIPEVVSERYQSSICEIPEVVSERYQSSICEIPDRYLRDTQNNHIEDNHIEVTPSTSTTAAAMSEKTDDDVDDVVDAINAILTTHKRGERLTAQLCKQLITIHNLHSAAEILLAVRALASQQHIRSVIAVLKGKRTPNGYESGCFADGLCYLYAPDDTPPPQPTKTPSATMRGNEEHFGRIMAEAERSIAARHGGVSAQEYNRLLDQELSRCLHTA